MEARYPAPWTLVGDGYLLLYKFPRDFGEAAAAAVGGIYGGGLGGLFVINYHATNCGPYYELALVPGVIGYGDQAGYSVSHICVSTESSVVNGRANWGIPKFRADFHHEPLTLGADRYRVELKGQVFFDTVLEHGGLTLPVPSALSAALPNLVQRLEGTTFVTEVSGETSLRFASVRRMVMDADIFPDVSRFRPLIGFRMRRFNFTFGAPKV